MPNIRYATTPEGYTWLRRTLSIYFFIIRPAPRSLALWWTPLDNWQENSLIMLVLQILLFKWKTYIIFIFKAHFLKDLQPGGIEPSSVYIMSTGVQMATGERQGVVENFTMFSGKILMERAKLYMQEGEDVEKCTQPTVDGFITGMLAEAGNENFE